MLLRPIAILRSSYQNKLLTPRQSGMVAESRAELDISKEHPPEIIKGLKGFSHVWVIFAFHLNTSQKQAKGLSMVRPPRLGKKIGVLATRSPHRPNPLGLSLCRLINIQGRKVILGAVDMVDGTPVYDIKPYIPSDQVTHARWGWLKQVKRAKEPLRLRWSPQAKEQIKQFGLSRRFQRLVSNSLRLDPRPLVYYSNQKRGNKYHAKLDVMRSLVEGVDVEFVSDHKTQITVIALHLMKGQNHFDR